VEFQFHPASGSGAVRRWKLRDRRQKVAILATGATALAALSLWVTVPAVAVRALRDRPSERLAADAASARAAFGVAESRASAMTARARDAASLLARIAFLYRIPPESWPRTLNPEAGLLAGAPAQAVTSGLPRFLEALDRGLLVLAEKEAGDPRLAARTPSILPLATEIFEPAAVFGPRTSPWTGAEEFFTGLELASPAGSTVIASAEGTVAFAGRVKPRPGSRLWRYGNLVVLSHGNGQATLYGHLVKIEARRGQRVRRGERIGTVGSTGWVVSPSLHYEFWREPLRREPGGVLSPTDPRFAILDRRLGPPDLSLEKMAATSAPGPVEALPIR
jgi:murein DD-endopeptidase MepM/ murein hydrolase activator NlpD